MKVFDIHTHQQYIATDDICSIYNMSEDEILGSSFQSNPNTYYSCGIHPWNVHNSKLNLEDLKQIIINSNRIVAIGEAGLDKLAEASMEKQMEIFEAQIIVANEYNLPIIIHCVRAWDELLSLNKKHQPVSPWVIHGFRGGKEQAEQLQKLGFYFSIGANFKEEILDVVYPHSLFLETDDTDLNVKDLYNNISTTLGIETSDLMGNIRHNVKNVFKLIR